MTQEEKELLLRDLCARLPYGVICKVIKIDNPFIGDCKLDSNWLKYVTSVFYEIKPYLRPMSSMTEEEMGNLEKCLGKKYDFRFTETESFIYIDWLNAHHFDYRGLIEMGLALEAPDGMYND